MPSRAAVAAAVAAGALLAVGAQDPSGVIRPGVPWFDTDGHRVYAGGANMYLDNGRYYIVGEGNKVRA